MPAYVRTYARSGLNEIVVGNDHVRAHEASGRATEQIDLARVDVVVLYDLLNLVVARLQQAVLYREIPHVGSLERHNAGIAKDVLCLLGHPCHGATVCQHLRNVVVCLLRELLMRACELS